MIDVPEILDDGTPFVDLQAAIQAAWIAGERQIAAELSRRYGLYNKLCLRCAVPSQSVWAWAHDRSPDCVPDSILARLCQPCQHEELAPYTKYTKPVQIIDGPGWTCATKTQCPVDLKPMLDKLKDALAKLPPVEIVTVKPWK